MKFLIVGIKKVLEVFFEDFFCNDLRTIFPSQQFPCESVDSSVFYLPYRRRL